jgi:WD40 repeat protein
VNSIDFTKDGLRFTTSSNDGSAKLFDCPSCKFLTSFRGHKGWVTSSMFSADGNVIVTSSNDKYVRLWDIRTSKSSQEFGPMRSDVTRAAFHPDGSIIGYALENGSFSVVDTRNQQVIQTYDRVHRGRITSLRFHPTGSFALTTSIDAKVCIWDLIEGQLFFTIAGHKAAIYDGRWSSDGSQFLTCDRSGVVLQWKTNFDKLIETIEVDAQAEDQVEQRLKDAMDIAPPTPRSRAPEPTPAPQVPPSTDQIEAALNRMVNQIDFLVQTATMMDRRTAMLRERLSQLQEVHQRK